jgi:polysaccharide deacetylase 2 family uncharacterized protein YibQ
MASNKPPRRRKKRSLSKKKGSKGNQYKAQLTKALIGMASLISLVLIAMVLAHNLLLNPPIKLDPSPMATNRVPSEAHLSKPTYEIFPKQDTPPSIPIEPTGEEHSSPVLPKLAIIIDDVGYDLNIVRKFIELNGPFTFALLPKAPYTADIIRLAQAKNFEIILHLPMEPKEYPKVNPGPGALLTTMAPDQLIAQLTENISEIPNIRGVNNHMGSKMTSSSIHMRQIFTILKKRELYFIDSRTGADTVCRSSAILLKLPFAQRDVFIDHILEPRFIRQQIDTLIQCTRKKGQAVGIAHPHIITFDVLRDILPKIKKEIQLVPASLVVHQLR